MPSNPGIPRLTIEGLCVLPLAHPQGCRGYLVIDPESREALAVDVHLDQVHEAVHYLELDDWRLGWVIDTHTHADHPSGAAALAAAENAVRVAHRDADHAGVAHLAEDDSSLTLGDRELRVCYAPGHTPDSMVLVGAGAVFSGDSLLIGAVARADFIGGDPGTLYDSIHDVLLGLPDETTLFPGHDYARRLTSTIGEERASNPWLQLDGRDAFVDALSANPPPEPANMQALLRLNREGRPIPPRFSAAETVRHVRAGGAGTILDVRTEAEIQDAHIPGSKLILLDEIAGRIEEVLATPAPRLLLCHSGQRAESVRQYLTRAGVSGLSTIDGGIVAYAQAGGAVTRGAPWEPTAATGSCAASSPPSGGCAATPPPAESGGCAAAPPPTS